MADLDEGAGDHAALRARLDKLSSSLESQRGVGASNPSEGTGDPTGGNVGKAMSLGFRVLSEFVAAIVVGAVIGWQLDRWIGASPLFLILFLALGTAAGFWNVYRISMNPTGRRGP